jgi:hypothetical protein
MSTVTPNFLFPVPQSTDLVKDGATAIAALGTSIDTQFVDLKGGTTGQVLAKASNTDLDYSWVAQDDSNAIQNSIVDAKGDLIGATANDTPARLAVGTNGQVLTADSTAATGLAWSTISVPTSLGFAAGKNKMINGDFGVWQRGTSGFGLGAAFNADRWAFYRDGSGATEAITQQTFTPGAAPVAGYESQYFWRYAATVAGTGGTERSLYTKIEDVRTFANQTITLSFWAKADATRTITLSLKQNFGSGGSTEVTTSLTSQSATTSWARYSVSVALPSISGKTVGTSSYLQLTVGFPVNVTETIDLWGFQLEAGSSATAFQTATGTIQGELAACQRYYEKTYIQSIAPATATQDGAKMHPLVGSNVTSYLLHWTTYKVEKRGTPSITIYDFAGNSGKVTVMNNSTTVNTDNITGYVDNISSSAFRIYETGTSCGGYQYHYTASAEL